MLESVKNCSSVCKEEGTHSWISRVAHGCKPPDWSTRAKHARSWSVAPFTTGQKFQAGQAVCSRLELATQPSREVKPLEHPVWQNMTFHIPSHPTIYIPLFPRFIESFEKEFWERNPREKKIDSSTIFTQKTLQIPLLSSSPLSNPWEALYQNLFSPYPFLWEGYLVFWEAVRKEPISYWLMLWPSSGIREARKEIGLAQPRWSKKLGGLRYIG